MKHFVYIVFKKNLHKFETVMTSYVNVKSNNTISLYIIISYDFCVPITWKNILKICRTCKYVAQKVQ